MLLYLLSFKYPGQLMAIAAKKPALDTLSTTDREGSDTRAHISWELGHLWRRAV